MPEIVAELDEHQFRRCPVTYFDGRGESVLKMAARKYLESFNGRELLALPPKRVEAIRYATALIAKHGLTVEEPTP